MTVAEHLIHHIAVVWDESDHVSAKHSPQLAQNFWAGYLLAFPEAKDTAESPGVIATSSPFFAPNKISSFFHEGTFIPYTGRNKDLAIAKWCTIGVIDQDEKSRFVLDDLREMRFRNGDPPMHANSAAMVTLVTSDWGGGMSDALHHVQHRSKAHRCNFSCIRLNKTLAQGVDRMTNAGYLLGQELKKRFIRIEKGGLLLRLAQDAN